MFNPFAIWTDIALKSGAAMLDVAQAAIARPKPKVAVLPSEDAPSSKGAAAKRPRPKDARQKRRPVKRGKRAKR